MKNGHEPLIGRVCSELVARYGVHSVVLYGSRANGTATPDSDYDIAAFGPVERLVRDARQVDGSYLDVFIYPEAELAGEAEEHLKLRGAKVLMQRGSEAEEFLARLDRLHARGPAPLSTDEIALRKSWALKMVARIERGDDEGNYRRVWLLTALLEDYFALRGKWFDGPKKALQWLAGHDPASHRAFSIALRPGADVSAIRALAERVIGE